MNFRLVPKSVTLNVLERRNGRCIALFHWLGGKPAFQHITASICSGNLCTSLLYFVVCVYTMSSVRKFTFAISSPDELLCFILNQSQPALAYIAVWSLSWFELSYYYRTFTVFYFPKLNIDWQLPFIERARVAAKNWMSFRTVLLIICLVSFVVMITVCL